MKKILRFDQDLFNQIKIQLETKNIEQNDLKRLIGEKNKQLQQFPRQNRNCIDYFEKYKLKYEELESKFKHQE